MSSSRVMASSSSATSDLTRQSSIYSLKSLGSMNIDELFCNTESDGTGGDASTPTISRQRNIAASNNNSNDKMVDEVWREINGGEMTLEDFLARAGAMSEEDVRVPSEGIFEPATIGATGLMRGGMNRDATVDPVERAAIQRQKRMIKNRESAARSRERKQAYTAELESLVTQLEEENAQLLRHQEERERKRLKHVLILLCSLERVWSQSRRGGSHFVVLEEHAPWSGEVVTKTLKAAEFLCKIGTSEKRQRWMIEGGRVQYMGFTWFSKVPLFPLTYQTSILYLNLK